MRIAQYPAVASAAAALLVAFGAQAAFDAGRLPDVTIDDVELCLSQTEFEI